MRRCLLLLSLLAVGCSSAAGETKPTRYVLVVAVDLSGSFAEKMATDGKAYEFLVAVVERYFRDRIGKPDRVIVAQLSGTNRSLLWEGPPRNLMRDFSARTFRDYLLSKADPNGSHLHDGIMHALEYLMSDPQVTNGQAHSALFILSDMLDNADRPEESEAKLVAMLGAYARVGGTLGMYYVDQFQLPKWRKHAQEAGFVDPMIESEIVGRPTLPSFKKLAKAPLNVAANAASLPVAANPVAVPVAANQAVLPVAHNPVATPMAARPIVTNKAPSVVTPAPPDDEEEDVSEPLNDHDQNRPQKPDVTTRAGNACTAEDTAEGAALRTWRIKRMRNPLPSLNRKNRRRRGRPRPSRLRRTKRRRSRSRSNS